MYDEEIEKAVLFYTIFKERESNLNEQDFIKPLHKAIIIAINELRRKKVDRTILTIKSQIEEDGINTDISILEYLANLGDYISYTSFETSYKILKKYTKRRQLFDLATNIKQRIQEDDEPDVFIEKQIEELHKIEYQTEVDNNFVQQVADTVEQIEKSLNTKKSYDFYTGIYDLDDLTDGLHRGELTIIGARPGVGKTTFSMQIAERIASKGKSVAYVSLEMSETQLIQKLLSKKARVNSRKIRNSDLTEEELLRLGDASVQVSQLPFSIITKANSIQKIEIEARRLYNKGKLDLLVIDYLQLVRNDGKFNSREQEVADISRTLNLLSLELNIPIIALCQLNRNASVNTPTLADIRESGSIEQDADNVIFLYPKSADSNIITIDLQKQRAGSVGSLNVLFNKFISEFVNVER